MRRRLGTRERARARERKSKDLFFGQGLLMVTALFGYTSASKMTVEKKHVSLCHFLGVLNRSEFAQPFLQKMLLWFGWLRAPRAHK